MEHTSPANAATSDPRPEIAKDGLQIALQVLGLSESPPAQSNHRDPVLIAIDFENITGIGKDSASGQEPNTQVGLAVLDTRDINASTPRENIISTYNFTTGSKEHYHRAQLKFLFGKPVLISAKDMLTNIKHCIPQNRNILLIGHDIRHEISALSKLKADFRELCITGLLDTFQITR